MQAEEADTEEEKKELLGLALEAFEKVPATKKNFSSKRAFHAKMVLWNANKYLEDRKRIVLPALEIMYLWNVFQIASCKPGCLEQIIEKIEAKLCVFTEKDDLETFLWLLFMKACCLSHLKSYSLAIEGFQKILAKLVDCAFVRFDNFLIAFSVSSFN